jgi:hypothetical protein
MGVSNLFRLNKKASFDELIPIIVDELIPIRVDELIPMDVSDLFSRPIRINNKYWKLQKCNKAVNSKECHTFVALLRCCQWCLL